MQAGPLGRRWLRVPTGVQEVNPKTNPLRCLHITSNYIYLLVELRWPRLVGQLGGLFKVYSDCHSYRQNLLGQIFLSLLLRL